MARRATLQDILETGEKDVVIPGLTDAAGEPLTIRVRKVHAGERQALLPQVPAHLFENLPEKPDDRQAELMRREVHWLGTLSAAQVDMRRRESSEFCYRLLALAALDPILTVDDARRLGDGALELAGEILEFSKNKPVDEAARLKDRASELAGQLLDSPKDEPATIPVRAV
jgi:hypothetical protein